MADERSLEVPEEKTKHDRMIALSRKLEFNEKRYEFDDKFIPAKTIEEAHTVAEMIRFAESDPNVEIEARVLHWTPDGIRSQKYDKKRFIETFKTNNFDSKRFRESSFREAFDTFLDDDGSLLAPSSNVVGNDFIPLLGGPFNKQLYYYDYLRMHAISFHAAHHDPIAKRIVNTMLDFTLGRGWRVDCENEAALSVWRAAEEANDMYSLVSYMARELSTYGEVMVWELPDLDTKIQYRVHPGQEPNKGLIPRFRLIDPSVIWEIVTYPEDITRVLYYQWVAPTQYQMYSGQDEGSSVNTTKFIYQQIPGDQVDHFKVNCVSNEKRGRSDLFPILGYLKRARDIVNYRVISEQKNAAWAIDTTIEGSQSDIDDYIDDQNSMGTIAPAGSEFVHTSKVKREYLSNKNTGSHDSAALDSVFDMIAAGSGIPYSYFGFHKAAGQSRASALVSTEPVAKMFEMRQLVYERILKAMAKRVFKRFGIDAEIEVTFPEIITQDRTAKLKDLALSQQMNWIHEDRAATAAAKEFSFNDYEYEEEKAKIDSSKPALAPLTSNPKVPKSPNDQPPELGLEKPDSPTKPSAVTSDEKHDLSMNYGA